MKDKPITNDRTFLLQKGFYVKRILLYYASLLILSSACAADPDLGESPGSCQLRCSSAKIASNDMRIRFLSPPDVAVNCYGDPDTPYPLAIPVRFVVEKKETTTASESANAGDGTSEVVETWTPVDGISFYPLVMQGQGGVANEDGRDQFQGIITPPGEWCTDSCGVGAVSVKPLCRSQINTLKIGIFSGSINEAVMVSANPPDSENATSTE